MNSKIVAVIIIIIGVVAVSSVYFESASHTSTGTTLDQSVASESGMNIQIISDNLTVGYQSGLWQVALQNSGNVAVSKMVVYLQTPIPSQICSGDVASSGLSFSNCTIAPSGNPLPPGSTVSGYATGIGEGSAIVGSHYPVGAKIIFQNGDTAWVNSTVLASNPP